MILIVIILMIFVVPSEVKQLLTAEDQLALFAKKAKSPISIMKTFMGAPIEKRDTASINTNLLRNIFFIQHTAHQNRERIPERTVHAKGAGAFGYFEVTSDKMSRICKAKLFKQIGENTPIFVRFSNQVGSLGSSDTARENRGFSIKFYTEEGNFDLPGLALEVFNIKDPILFPSVFHAIKKNPKTGLFDKNSKWDFITRHQETVLNTMLLYSDLGIVDGFRHMPGFGVHPYAVYNDKGETNYVKFHILPDAGIKTLTFEEAAKIQGKDPDYGIKDLYEAILNGNYPSWTIAIQHLTPQDIANATFDVFDLTLKWPKQLYPLIDIGRIVLNENPNNFFANVEQVAFCPGNLIPGILGGVDKIFEARRFSYLDAHYYRLGANFYNIDVNYPYRTSNHNYYRDGVPPLRNNQDGIPNYYPNSFNGPVPYIDKNMPYLIEPYTDSNPTNFGQASELYENEMDDGERTRLVSNIVRELMECYRFIQTRAVAMFTKVNPDLGHEIAYCLWEENASCV